MPVSYSFSSGSPIVAAELNTNFSDVLSYLSGITVADLHDSSGLLSTNLADRFATCTETILLVPRQDMADATMSFTTLDAALPNTNASPGTELFRKHLTIRSGKTAYLVSVSVYAIDVTVNTANANPALWVTRNGTVLGGGEARFLADATRYVLQNNNPFDNPLTSLADGDYLTIGAGCMPNAAGDTDWSGVTVTFTYKFELGG